MQRLSSLWFVGNASSQPKFGFIENIAFESAPLCNYLDQLAAFANETEIALNGF